MKSEKSSKLTKVEREKLYRMLRFPNDYSLRAIARALGRSHTTIIREIARNGPSIDKHEDYKTQSCQAHEAAQARRKAASKRMRLKSETIRHYVELHLKEAQWSPELIAGRLTLLGYPVSDEAIYLYIHEERSDLKSSLLIAGKSRRRRRCGKRSNRTRPKPAAPKRSIEELPLAAKERLEIGHFELDAIVGKKGKSVLQNKVDRKSRKVFLDKAPTLESKPYSAIAAARLLRDVPEKARKSILQDNGPEHAYHPELDKMLGTQSFFAHPYCASERGTVENRNGRVRRYLPKGTDFDEIPDDYIEWIEDYYNNLPMKLLGFRTPNEIWNLEVKNL